MQNLSKQYQRLLRQSETTTTLDKALRLVDRVLSAITEESEDLRRSLTWAATVRRIAGTGSLPNDQNSQRIRKICACLEYHASRLKDHASSFTEAQFSLLMDVLLVVFHQAYFVVLPSLRDRSRIGDRKTLLKAFDQFADSLTGKADQHQTVGLIHAARHDFEAAILDFRVALAATHSDDHEFMSRLQLLWTFLLEHGQNKVALDLLLEVYPRMITKHLEEMQCLIRDTFEAFPTTRENENRPKKAILKNRAGKRPTTAA
jgi:hypothetical protein